jgi:hypothetical protein
MKGKIPIYLTTLHVPASSLGLASRFPLSILRDYKLAMVIGPAGNGRKLRVLFSRGLQSLRRSVPRRL